ncbi:MAG: hypothetical protein HGA76_11375 [Candidatus Firestonebacteria bacterium]|nr:hypothetical protein [Candidatus Firestonebacteria bacterium]
MRITPLKHSEQKANTIIKQTRQKGKRKNCRGRVHPCPEKNITHDQNDDSQNGQPHLGQPRINHVLGNDVLGNREGCPYGGGDHCGAGFDGEEAVPGTLITQLFSAVRV